MIDNYPAILTQDIVTLAPPSGPMLVHTAFALLTSTILLVRISWNFWRIVRPAYYVPLLVNLFYQWPAAILFEPINSSMMSAWWFLAVSHTVALSVLVYAMATWRLDLAPAVESRPQMGLVDRLVPVLLLPIFAALFFQRMPFRCTALSAMLFDPTATLLAREVTIKFAGSTLATASFGALANTIAPVCIAVSFWSIINSTRSGKAGQVLMSLLWVVVAAIAFVLILVSGTKGLLLPTIIVSCATAFLWTRSPSTRAVAVLATIVCIGVSLVLFESMRERGGGIQKYDLASCAVELGACQPTLDLLASMSEAGGLGLEAYEVEEITTSVLAQCSNNSLTATTDDREFRQPVALSANLLAHHFMRVVYRAFVLPMQVASWHYLHVEEFGPPGVGALPFALKIYGHSVDMATTVYQAYGTIYSGGDRTSTSTSPTSFIHTYPAYFQLAGLLAVLVIVCGFDLVVSVLLRILPPQTLAIAAGLMAVTAFNFIASDFFVVMISHGGGVAVFLLGLYAALGLFRGTARPPDTAIASIEADTR